jgi:tetratricopeptide (TPR) repeat protein
MTHRLLILVLLSLTLYITSVAQKSKLQGYLYNDQEEPEGRIQLRALPSKPVTTASDGHFKIFFQTLGPGENVNLVLDRANWLVYDPLFGKTTSQVLTYPWSPKIYIAEKGSKILLGSKAILALIRQRETERIAAVSDVARLQTEIRRLQTQNIAISKELSDALERERENRDLNVYLDRYAAFYGFSKDEILSAVIEWAKPAPTDTEEVAAFKLLFNRNYIGAETLAFAGAQKEMDAWVRTGKHKTQLEKYQEKHARSVIRQMHIAIVAPYRERRFRDALHNYGVLQKFLAENHVLTDSFQPELASACLLSANSKAYLSRTVTPRRGPEARRLLGEAIEQFRELLTFHSPERSPQVWAGIQINLANALQELVFNIGVPNSAELLKEAETASREAIRIWRLEPSTLNPSDPSSMNCNCGELHLATALHRVGLLGGPDSIQRLKDAEQAYRGGLASIDRNVQPQEWLFANLNLARVLQDLGRRDGSDAADYHKKAEGVMRALLAATEGLANQCGCIEAGLASVLQDQGLDHRGPEALQFLNDADAHYKAALELTSQRDLPEMWAQITMNRAFVHQQLGERSKQNALTFFRQAEEAWRKVLSLGEHEIFPQDRVRAQSGLADALRHLARILPERERYLKQAETEGRKAVALSKDPSVVGPCGCTIATLGGILQELAQLGGPKSIDYFKEAEKLFREALKVDSQTDWEIKAGLASVRLDLGLAIHPIDQEYVRQSVSGFREYFENTRIPKSRPTWAGYRAIFGRGLHIQSEFEVPPNVNLLKESEAAFLTGIEWFTFEEDTQSWIMARVDIGTVLMHLAALDPAARITHLKKAESIYREIFTHDIRQQYPTDWIVGQRDLGMALEKLAHMPGENHKQRLKEAETFLREALKFNLLQPDQINVVPTKFRLANVLEDLATEKEESDSNRIAYLQEAKALQLDLAGTTNPDISLVDWSESMRKLADISRTLARLGPNPLIQLKEAEGFIKRTEKYPLLERDKEQWLRIQVTLGDVLHDFASADTRRYRKYLKNVKRVYEEALIVGTRQRFPGEWADLTYGLARTHSRLDNLLEAKRLLLEVLDHDPKDGDALANLSSIYHERLFDFAGSFDALTRLLKMHSDDLEVQTNFAENHFTTGRFEECAAFINNLLANKDVDEGDKIALRAIEIGSLIGSGNTNAVLAKLDLLIKELQRQPPAFEVGWQFDGAMYFARRHAKTAPFSGWVKTLFNALGKGDRDRILKALQVVRSKFKPPKERVAVQGMIVHPMPQIPFSKLTQEESSLCRDAWRERLESDNQDCPSCIHSESQTAAGVRRVLSRHHQGYRDLIVEHGMFTQRSTRTRISSSTAES